MVEIPPILPCVPSGIKTEPCSVATLHINNVRTFSIVGVLSLLGCPLLMGKGRDVGPVLTQVCVTGNIFVATTPRPFPGIAFTSKFGLELSERRLSITTSSGVSRL